MYNFWKTVLFLSALFVYVCNAVRYTPVTAVSRTTHQSTERLLKNSIPAIEPKSSSYFWQCGLAGAISCSFTHSIMIPLDVIKTKIQSSNALGKLSTMAAFRDIIKKDGYGVLLQGFAATFSGYFVQGTCKFGFYELYKYKLSNALSKRNIDVEKWQLPIWLTASGAAEIVASWALCPLEVTKIYMMMNPVEAKEGIWHCINKVANKNVFALFNGLPLIMLRQVPYTCVKLSGYELYTRLINRSFNKLRSIFPESPLFADGSYSELKQMVAGVLAGVSAAVVSQPADVLLSKLCGSSSTLTECVIIDGLPSIIQMCKDIGFKGCYAGLAPRAMMVGILTALQFSLYETAKAKVSYLARNWS